VIKKPVTNPKTKRVGIKSLSPRMASIVPIRIPIMKNRTLWSVIN
jgi:hypothetical protein